MITVRVPATTANLGPGFDCLGLALTLYNRVEMDSLPSGLSIEIEGEGADSLPKDVFNLVYRSTHALFDRIGRRPPGIRLRLINAVPLMRGLGSSSAAVIGGLMAANTLAGAPLDQHSLLALATEIEGHPDNVAPALFGGLVAVSSHEGEVLYARPAIAPLHVVVVTPDLQVSTAMARRILPTQVSRADAVFNVGRAVLVALALQAGDFDLLGRAMEDRLHQPYRARLIPGLDNVFEAARAAGAAGVAISGAGPSVVAFGPEKHEAIAQAMVNAFDTAGLNARSFILGIDTAGAQVEL
ncbi:MAG: homoserine kinase [Chloroflexi bacterium RBG_16_57_9]|nr:MAG: homoserine kinase [Chloroflexi bacterium RBG_16_57_9]